MPFLNSRGQAVMGMAGGPASLDGREIANPGGGACWLDDDRVLLQTQIDGVWQLAIVLPSTGEVEPIRPIRGANGVAAGGGQWLAWLDHYGLYGSMFPLMLPNGTHVDHLPDAGLRGAGPDGTLAYVRDFQSGLGLVLHAPNGSEFEGPADAEVIDLQVLGPLAAIWSDSRTIHTLGFPQLRPAAPPGRMRVVAVDGQLWLIYWSEGVGLIAQADGATDGYILETRPNAFQHDARVVNGRIVVVYSETDGYRPQDHRRRELDLAAPRVPIVAKTPDPIDPPDPVDPTDPEPTTMEAKALPDGIREIAIQLAARNPLLAHSKDDDDRRDLQKMICETARARFGPSYGWKSNHGINNANAKDAIAQLPEGAGFTPNKRQALYIWDLFNGTTRAVNASPIMSETKDFEQFFVPVEPIDHLESVPVDPHEPDNPTPPPTVDLTNILRRLDALEKPKRIALRTDNGHYVCAEGGGGYEVNATRTAAGAWEIFTVEPQG